MDPPDSGAMDNFSHEQFVRELNRPTTNLDQLLQSRKKVQSMVDDTNARLKQNVYKNYALFIDTAKEISLLKNEMYTLSHLLTEQQQLLSNLTDISISGDKSHGLTLNEKKEVAAKFRSEGPKSMPKSQSMQVFSASAISELNNIVERIEGAAGMLETRNRILINCGEATELDANDYSKIPGQGRTFILLLNDALMLAQALPFPNRLGKKYKFQALYELDSIAVVNVKDQNVKTAFKVLMLPTTRVYEVDSLDAKKKWIDSFDQAKKQRRASLTLHRRDSMQYMPSNMSMDGLSSIGAGGGLMSPGDRPGYSFDEVPEFEDVDENESEQLPLWLQEVPEDMDVMIAQRNFEDAVALVHKVNDHLVMYPKCYDGFLQTDLKLRTNNKIQELVDIIANELQMTPDRSLQSGPRSARRAVQLLLRLGKSSMATKLFLSQRTALLKFSLKQQISEGAVLQYIKRMSSTFFNNIIDSCREFEKAFRMNTNDPSAPRDASLNSLGGERDNVSLNQHNDRSPTSPFPAAYPLASLVSWAQNELLCFFDTFSRTVFMPQVPPTISAECVSIIRTHCNRLRTALGLDLLFYLDQLLKEDLDRIILESSDKLVESIKGRKRDEKWTPHNFKTKPALNKFLDDMKDIGLFIINTFVYDECKISLAHSTTIFAKLFLSMTHDLLKLSTPFTHRSIIEALDMAFRAQMSFVEMALRGEYNSQSSFIRRNAEFLLDNVLPVAEQKYSEKVGIACKELSKLRSEFAFLKSTDQQPAITDDSNGAPPETRKKRSPSKTQVSINDGKVSSITYL